MAFLTNIPPFALLLLAVLVTYAATALGAAIVFCFRELNQKMMDIMLGISAGIMLAASLWSLIIPAVNLANEMWQNAWLAPTIGFCLGSFLIIGSSLLLERKLPPDDTRKRNILLIGAVTLHNIPEGLAVGVGFSGFALGMTGCDLAGAVMLAIGIAIQNFPDGLAISMPLYRDGMSRRKAFFWGQASGLVESIATIVGYFLTMAIRHILPVMLTIAAGAMITVVIGELIPSIDKNHQTASTTGFICGFMITIILDIVLNG